LIIVRTNQQLRATTELTLKDLCLVLQHARKLGGLFERC